MPISAAMPAIHGFHLGHAFTIAKRTENSVRAGGSSYMTAICQMWEGSQVLGFLGKTAQVAAFAPVSLVHKAVVYITPVLLAIAKNSAALPEKIRSAAAFLQNHLSKLYLVATVICNLALLYFGHLAFAIPALTVLGLGVLDQNGWLPLVVRQLFHRHRDVLLVATSLIAGGVIDRIFGGLHVAALCANYYLARKKAKGEGWSVQQNLTLERIQAYCEDRLKVKINRNFLQYNPSLPTPEIDIQCLVAEFDKIDWKQHMPTLRAKLKNDPRFVERHKTPDLKTDQQIIDFTRKSLQTFMTSVKEQRILEGEPLDYDRLHIYLKNIAKNLTDETDDIKRTDTLFRLAVEGGEYCGPGKFEVAESVYMEIMGGDHEVSIEDKVIYCLQDERNLWFQTFYQMAFGGAGGGSTVGKVIEWTDIHNYNIFLNLYGDEFGLRKSAANNDSATFVDPLTKWFIARSRVAKGINNWFWKMHTKEQHMLTLTDAIGTPQLPKPEVYAYWQKWIDRQQITDARKAELHEELADGRLYGVPLEDDGKFSALFVMFMLIDMGILEIESELPPLVKPEPVAKPAPRSTFQRLFGWGNSAAAAG